MMFRSAKIVLVVLMLCNISKAQDSTCVGGPILFLTRHAESIQYCQYYIKADHRECKSFLKSEYKNEELRYSAQYMGYEVNRWFRKASIVKKEAEADYFDYASGRLILLKFNCSQDSIEAGQDFVLGTEKVYTIEGEVETIIELTIKAPEKGQAYYTAFKKAFPNVVLTSP